MAVSVVVETDTYLFISYPAVTGGRIGRYSERVRRKQLEKRPGAEQGRLFLIQPLMQRFDITPESYLPTFRRRYSTGVPVVLEFALMPPPGSNDWEVVESLVISGIKFKDRDELTRKDLEFDLARIYFPEDFELGSLDTPRGFEIEGGRPIVRDDSGQEDKPELGD